MATGYKVVRKLPGQTRFVSVIQFTDYVVNEETKRQKDHGPLALFECLYHAEDFVEELEDSFHEVYVIFECNYTPSKDTCLWMPALYRDKRLERPADRLPLGTVLADSITLIKRVY